jgi:hypothetical protein
VVDRPRRTASAIAEAIAQCNDDAPCGVPICAVCALRFRIRFAAKVLALAQAQAEPHRFLTLHLEEFPPRNLQGASRRRFDRAGFQGAIIVCGTEVVWKEGAQTWLLHLQLLAIDLTNEDIKALRANWPEGGSRIPIKEPPFGVGMETAT